MSDLLTKLDEKIKKYSKVLHDINNGTQHCFSQGDIDDLRLDLAALEFARDMQVMVRNKGCYSGVDISKALDKLRKAVE